MSVTGSATIGPAAAAQPAKSARNILWLVAERGLKAVGGVGIGVLLARHLGPDQYGRYGAAIGLATLAKEAVMLGFDRIIRRDLAARPADAGGIVGTSITLGLALAFVVALGLTALAGHIVSDPVTLKLTRIVVWMALPQAFFACEIWFESAGMTRPLVWTRNAVWLSAVSGRIALVLADRGVVAFAVLALAEWVVTYAAVFLLLRRLHGKELRFSFERQQLGAWLWEGRPIILMAVFNSAADRLLVLLAQNLSPSPAEAGYLSAALRITDIWWSISTIIAAVLLPRIVRLQQIDPQRCERASQLYASASLLLGIAAALVVSLTAPFLVPLLFGQAYAPSAAVLTTIFWAGPAVFPMVARAQLWVSRGRLGLDLASVSAIAALQLGLAALLIPSRGAMGAATAITAAQWLGFYGVALAVPALRRASTQQFAAFRSLLAPVSTLRALAGFVRAMLRNE